MNSAIEFHDSEVKGISQQGETVVITFSKAYIHKSEGKPGVDAGSGWTQVAELNVGGASLRGALPEFPAELLDGHIRIDGELSEFPIPLNESGSVEVRLEFFSREYKVIEVIVVGKQVKLRLLGEPTHIEEFPGSGGSAA